MLNGPRGGCLLPVPQLACLSLTDIKGINSVVVGKIVHFPLINWAGLDLNIVLKDFLDH